MPVGDLVPEQGFRGRSLVPRRLNVGPDAPVAGGYPNSRRHGPYADGTGLTWTIRLAVMPGIGRHGRQTDQADRMGPNGLDWAPSGASSGLLRSSVVSPGHRGAILYSLRSLFRSSISASICARSTSDDCISDSAECRECIQRLWFDSSASRRLTQCASSRDVRRCIAS